MILSHLYKIVSNFMFSICVSAFVSNDKDLAWFRFHFKINSSSTHKLCIEVKLSYVHNFSHCGSCKWNGKTCDRREMFKLVWTDVGQCFVFNSEKQGLSATDTGED